METESDPTDAPFPTTQPSLMGSAVSPGAVGFREAWERLFRAYWPPLYAYLRRTGSSPEEAQDLIQEFFVRGLDGPMLGRFDARRGRFRAFLRACLHNLRSNLRRHERARPDRLLLGTLETDGVEVALADPRAVDPKDAFDREWTAHLFAQGLRALQGSLEAAGDRVNARVLQDWVSSPARPEAALLAQELGISVTDLYTRATRLRQALARALQGQIHQYSASVAIAIEERDAALRTLPGSP